MKASRALVSLMIGALSLQACASEPQAAQEGRRTDQAVDRMVRDENPDRKTALEAAGTSRSLGRFDLDRAMNHVRRLAREIGVRVRATRNERRASRYIKERFEDLGWRTFVQSYSVDGDTSWNVVARRPDVIDHPMVIGGHMDTVPRSPGANDNASGVAVVLEMARLLASKPQGRFVKLVAFGSEEFGRDGRHHVGSQAYVNRLSRLERRRFPGMISIDMIADGRPLIIGTAGIGPAVVARTLFRKIRIAGIRVVYRTTCDCSDNGPFERAGLPGAFVWSGLEPNYHEPSDTVPNLRPPHLARTGRAIRVFVRDLRSGLMRYFRRF